MTLGLILAGGRSSRMGHDKAFVRLGACTLIERAIAQLAPQVDRLAISSNADPMLYAEYDIPVVADDTATIQGPLAGVATALHRWPEEEMVTVAVDLAFIPADLVARLRGDSSHTLCRYAHDGVRPALAAWWAPQSATALDDFLARGRRAYQAWLQLHGEAVAFDARLACNINTPADLRRAEQLISMSLQVNAA